MKLSSNRPLEARAGVLGALLLTFSACSPTPLPAGDASVDRTGADATADVSPTCRTAADCGNGRYCDTTRGRCVECLVQEHCLAGDRVCSQGSCVASMPCTSARMCPGQVCDLTRMRCVDCVGDADCGGAPMVCRSNVCVALTMCASSRECSAAGLVCDTAARRCVECVADGDCPMGRRCNADRQCATSAGCTPGASSCVSNLRVRTCDTSGVAQERDCAVGELCMGGACRTLTCSPGSATCANTTTRQVCAADGMSSMMVPCASGQVCDGGVCRSETLPMCPSGQTRCGAACVTLQTDAANCGMCARACPAGQACTAGACAMVSDVIPPLNVARWSFGTVAYPDGRIFIIGGFGEPNSTSPLNTIEVYEPATGRWAMRSMPVSMGEVRAIGLADGRIYVANGFGSDGLIPQGRIYDPATDRWSLSSTSTSLRYISLSLGRDGAAYIFGGSDDRQPSGYGYIHRYDPMTDTMARLMPLVSPRRTMQSVLAGDGRIFVLGGTLFESIEVFDPSTRVVSRVPSTFPYGPANGGAVLGGDGRIYYVGGYATVFGSNSMPVNDSFVFDPASGALTRAAPLPQHRSSFALVARPGGRLTAIGGYNQVGEVRSVLASTVTYTIATNIWR
jgi:Cys-rich repeat protein